MSRAEPLHPDDPAAVGGYRLTGRLGMGGQGVVYLGTGEDGTVVAVKVLRPEIAAEPRVRERFTKEIAAAARVDPFCIAQVLDASLEGPRPYIVTEYIDGPSLQESGPRSGPALRRLAVATATALAAIHGAGIVHRDFKPSNVMLGPDGPRVIDFGIARDSESPLTVTSGIIGTPAYMAPEQFAGRSSGPAMDVWAWAAVVAFAATGRPPFGRDSLPAIMNRVLNGEPDLGDLPEPLASTVTACLAKDPAARPTMQDVLLRLLGSRPVLANDPVRNAPTPPARHPQGPAPADPSRRRRALVPLGAAAGVLAVMLGIGGVVWLQSPDENEKGPGEQAIGSDGKPIPGAAAGAAGAGTKGGRPGDRTAGPSSSPSPRPSGGASSSPRPGGGGKTTRPRPDGQDPGAPRPDDPPGGGGGGGGGGGDDGGGGGGGGTGPTVAITSMSIGTAKSGDCYKDGLSLRYGFTASRNPTQVTWSVDLDGTPGERYEFTADPYLVSSTWVDLTRGAHTITVRAHAPNATSRSVTVKGC
ncbi:serine/threonine protein kinase [Thermomonospora umbrina]|uniref:Serine/threonine protein kinase n=1 Tax=Thermomonospora umbrina TaxID=111806 RepID=A0A3D9SJ65_9ACTN|nr:serine/threonine-protein kinase [Thermomonospora umbrina]REE95962.1 serine/threonine protein kinase [Thermomonospora umbrina]